MIPIPAVDVRGGRAVRLTRGSPEATRVYADDPAEVAARFGDQGAALVHLVDLDAALGSGDNRAVIRRAIGAAGVPVQVGGGLRTRAAVREVLEAGAARAVLGTEAVADPGFLRRCLEEHGDRIVVAVDTDGARVRVRGWTEDAGPYEEVLARLAEEGAPRFLVTAVARDGTLEGPDVELYRRTVALTDRPVLASGGVARLDDLRALASTGVEGVVVGKALYEGMFTLPEALEAAS
jgi:phosphoribosyl isomerase A